MTRLFAAAAIAASLLARPGGQDEALRKLADRCGTEIEWQSRWDDAARKARQEGRTILVQICRNAHFIESDDSSARWLVLRSGLYSDPDLIRLLRSRFVCLRVLGKDDLRGLPFKAELEGHTLSGDGTAQVIATPDGRVLSEICTFDASRLLTAAAGACEGPRRTPLQDPMDEAEALLDRCEIAAALELSKSVKTFRAHRLRAAAYRRLRKGDEALAALASARAVAPAESQSDLDLEEGVLLLRLGRTDDAETLFRRVRGESRAEARFWAGACRFAKADPAGAAADWGLVATEHGDSRWAWKAAANLLGLGAIVHEVERLRWPPDPIPTSRPVPRADPDDSADLEKGAIEFLAATQRDDGSWPSPEEATLAALGYSEAVTAICAHALLPHRKQPEVERMLRRALAFLDRSLREGRLFAESCPAYNGRLWAHAFLIPLLVDLGDRGLSRHLPELVAAVRKSQQPSGAWDYAFRLSDIAVSFSTACTVLALQDARRAGIDVPEATLRRAVTLLRDMRTSQGWFPYWKALKESAHSTESETAGRGPLCSLALHRAGAAEVADVRRALEAFVKHRDKLARELRVVKAHTGPELQASYYYLFDHYYAARALALLPASERRPYLDAIRKGVREARIGDGSFLDSPPIGRAYGSAMALRILSELRGAK